MQGNTEAARCVPNAHDIQHLAARTHRIEERGLICRRLLL